MKLLDEVKVVNDNYKENGITKGMIGTIIDAQLFKIGSLNNTYASCFVFLGFVFFNKINTQLTAVNNTKDSPKVSKAR